MMTTERTPEQVQQLIRRLKDLEAECHRRGEWDTASDLGCIITDFLRGVEPAWPISRVSPQDRVAEAS